VDVTVILTAFGLGFAAAWARLPPLVGYLIAGFLLHAFGYETTGAIELVADIGVFLLLFGIGLKMRLRMLAGREVWAGATIHMAVITAIIGGLFVALGAFGLPLAAGLSPARAVLVGFAFSFSSTVFAVKSLEERNELASLPGRIAIGILIVQDLVAVGFLTASAGALPSIWAVPAVIAVIAARPLYGWLLDRSGHGELLALLGFFLAVGVGAGTFSHVGLKPDLGALIVGLTLANHRRAPELADMLLGLKDLLLIGFFLSIGLGGALGQAALTVALISLVFVPLKVAGHMLLLSRFRFRSQTAWHTSITLANHSEFGLIVVAVSIDQGFLEPQWATVVAVSMSMSLVFAAPLNAARYSLYGRWSDWLARIERPPIQPVDTITDLGDARVLVFGMGRIGAGAYDELVIRLGKVVLGVDRRDETVAANLVAGRRVIRGDALDRDMWDRVKPGSGIDLVLLAMSDHGASLEAARRVKEALPNTLVAASATFADEVAALERAGVDVARNIYGEAGQGLADDACGLLGGNEPKPTSE